MRNFHMGDLESKTIGEMAAEAKTIGEMAAEAKAHHKKALKWAEEEFAQGEAGSDKGMERAARKRRKHTNSLNRILRVIEWRFTDPPKPAKPTRECRCCGKPMSPPVGGHAWNFATCRKCVELLAGDETACGFHETHICPCRQQRADDRESFMGMARRAAADYAETD